MTQNTPQQRQGKPIIAQYLERHKDQIAAALPRHVNADRMARIALTECRKTPGLLKANPQSLFGAIIQCSQMGLEPGGALGHAYLIPFKDEVQLIIGYRGMIDLARRSGQVLSLTARAVYQQDEFSYEFGLNEDLRHVPADGDRGEITHVYAVAKLKDGGLQWDVMSRESVNVIRDASQGYSYAKRKGKTDNPWMTNYEEMAKKTVIRRLFKYLPVSVEMQRAGGLDEMADAGVSQQNDSIIEGEWEPGPLAEDQAEASKSKTDSIKDRLRSTDTSEKASREQMISQIKAADLPREVLKIVRQAEQDLPASDCEEVRSAGNMRIDELEDEEGASAEAEPTAEEALASQLVADIKATDDPDEVRAMLEQAEVELSGTHKAKVTRAGNARLEEIGGDGAVDNPLE